MDLKQFRAKRGEYTFLIEEDFLEPGAYMYICKAGKGFKDELQNSINICKEIALKEYGVPLNAWEKVR